MTQKTAVQQDKHTDVSLNNGPGVTEENQLPLTSGKGIREGVLEKEMSEMGSCPRFKIYQKVWGNGGGEFQVEEHSISKDVEEKQESAEEVGGWGWSGGDGRNSRARTINQGPRQPAKDPGFVQ